MKSGGAAPRKSFIFNELCRWNERDSNPRPSDYESPALTTELSFLFKILAVDVLQSRNDDSLWITCLLCDKSNALIVV